MTDKLIILTEFFIHVGTILCEKLLIIKQQWLAAFSLLTYESLYSPESDQLKNVFMKYFS